MVSKVELSGVVLTSVADGHLAAILATSDDPKWLWAELLEVWAALLHRRVAGSPRPDIPVRPLVWSKASGRLVSYFRRQDGQLRVLGVGYLGEDATARVLAES